MSIHTWVPLLESVLRQSPALPGALCRGQSATFDAADDDQFTEAVRLCRSCQALGPCSAWADTMGDNDVSGVVAGREFVWAPHPSLRRPPRTAP
jgi:hypothetical protein